LAARVLIRKGTLYVGDGPEGNHALAQAETQLRAILADRNLLELHPAAQRLLGFVDIRLHTEHRFHELEQLLSTAGDSKTFHQDLADYLWLLDRESFAGVNAPGSNLTALTAERKTAPEEKSMIQSGEMTDWIFAFQSGSYADSLQRWQKSKSLPWLVAAITKARPTDAAVGDLSAAAAKVPPVSPAYVTLSFHRFRLLEQTGDKVAVRAQVDQFLAEHGSPLLLSAKNEELAMRTKLADN